MLSPDLFASRVILWVVFAALLGMLVYRAARKERKEYQRFKRFERTKNRQAMLRKWLLDSLAMFGGAAVIILLLTWQYVTRFLVAVGTWPIARWFHSVLNDSGGLVPGLAIGAAVVIVGGTVLAVYLARRTDSVPTIGDISALLPRNRRELAYGAALSINAGVVEELLFRLAIPLVVFGASGSALVAVIVSVLLFGALHLYQGVPGIVGAIAIGSLLMVLYLATGNILVPIVAHALFDLRSLVLIPVIVFRVHLIRP